MRNDNPEGNKIRRKSASSSGRTTRTSDPSSNRKKSTSSNGTKKRPASSSSSKTRAVGSSGRTRKVDPNQVHRNDKNNKKVKNASKNRKGSKVLKKKKKNKFLRKAFRVIVAGVIIMTAISLGVIFASLKDVKPVNEALLDKLTHKTTTIKYANGETMSTAPTLYKKTPIPLSDMSPYLRKAIVSIEDERYYSHNGVDTIGLVRSVVKTLLGNRQGGSTIPMQVSKVMLTSTDQTISRKIKDMYYALEMDKTIGKDKILETYLNNYFVGRGIVGAEAGSMGYFNKHCADLTLGEAALLAGVTKNPSKYAPYTTARLTGSESKSDLDHKLLFFLPSDNISAANQTEMDMYNKLYEWDLVDLDTYKQLRSGELLVRKAVNNPEAKRRQEQVLAKMKELNVITDKQYVEAMNQPINIRFPDAKEKVANSVESLIEYDVIDALMEQGKTEEEARNLYYNGGLIINSTIDPKIQKTIEEQYDKNSNFPNHKVADNGLSQPQSATVILDYKTGNIKGLIGGRNIKARKTLNRAITPYQPGSTIKPLSVYTPAIDTGKVTQSTLMSDVRGGYRFKQNQQDNPDTTTRGYGSMCLRHGLALSSNTIAYKTGELLGPTYDDCIDVMMDYLRNFGITSVLDFKEENKPGRQRSDRHFNSLVLGGLTRGISPLQMSAAFGALANGGVYVEPEIFTTITTYNGELIVKNTPKTHKVVDPAVAYVMTDMLKAVVSEGIGRNASLGTAMPVAGKTGSTNNFLDTWFVGFTPYYVGSCYIGDDAGIKNSDGTIMKRRPIEGGASMSSAKLWSNIMKPIHQNLEVKKFPEPQGVYLTKINPVEGGRSAYGVLAAFLNGTSPDRYSSYGIPRKTPTQTQQGAGQATQGQGTGIGTGIGTGAGGAGQGTGGQGTGGATQGNGAGAGAGQGTGGQGNGGGNGAGN